MHTVDFIYWLTNTKQRTVCILAVEKGSFRLTMIGIPHCFGLVPGLVPHLYKPIITGRLRSELPNFTVIVYVQMRSLFVFESHDGWHGI